MGPDVEQPNYKEHADWQSRLNDELAVMLEKMEREAFEKWWRMEGTFCDNPFTSKKETALESWKARGVLNKPCRGVEHHGCNYLAPCGSICNKCGQAV
jgi:hypothetical protein